MKKRKFIHIIQCDCVVIVCGYRQRQPEADSTGEGKKNTHTIFEYIFISFVQM